jgi:DNA-directed RNA polymerase specialized sigma24 family protein
MSDVTRILAQIDSGDPAAAEQLLPLVYDELRKLAAAKLAHEKPGQTLQATALVHEAFLRLVGKTEVRSQESEVKQDGGLSNLTSDSHPLTPAFNSCGHFFAAAAEAMRRILVENARRKGNIKHGGGRQRVYLDGIDLAVEMPDSDLLALDEALTALAEKDSKTARLVQLHCFAGLTIEQAAVVLGIPERTAYRDWAFARAWLHRQLRGTEPTPGQ